MNGERVRQTWSCHLVRSRERERERDVALVFPYWREARSIALEQLVSSSMIYICEKYLEDC